MRVTKLVVAMALLLSATSATLAQDLQCLGDRPYYDYDSAGWLDYNYHPGIDCNIALRGNAHPRVQGHHQATDSQQRSMFGR
jgi:hypothetical protein